MDDLNEEIDMMLEYSIEEGFLGGVRLSADSLKGTSKAKTPSGYDAEELLSKMPWYAKMGAVGKILRYTKKSDKLAIAKKAEEEVKAAKGREEEEAKKPSGLYDAKGKPLTKGDIASTSNSELIASIFTDPEQWDRDNPSSGGGDDDDLSATAATPPEPAEPSPTARSPRSSTAKRTSGYTPLGRATVAPVRAVGNLFRRNKDAVPDDDDDTSWFPTTDENVNENRKPADDLVEIVIDFEELKKQELNESFLAMFGGWVEQILGSIFTGRSLPLAVKGSSRDVKSFAKALGGEKDYIEAARQYGLDHPTTYKNKAKLNNAIKGFEKDTGLKWPFKQGGSLNV